MMLKTVILLKCLVITLGFSVNDNEKNKEQERHLETPLLHMWETQHFLNDRISVEEESDEKFFALRERRASENTKSANGNNTDDGTGSTSTGEDDCSTDITECINDSECVEIDGKNICQCKKGYSGDGKTCNDVNECTTNPCHAANATCNNAKGSFSCVCNTGYFGDGLNCTDVNECATNVCHANATCNNTMGSFSCACDTGFIGDGLNCADIDECDVHPEICSVNATCNNTAGSFFCSCNDRLYGNGRTCNEINTEYSSKSVYTKPGKVAILVCTLNETIVWKKDGNRIQNDENKKAFQNILVIDPKDEDDFGEYFCEVAAYEGFGIKINLINVENIDPESSNGNLIPLVILAILLFVAILVIVYLIWTRKARPRANERTLADDNALYEMSRATSSKAVPDEENIYSDLSDEREQEPVYQGLIGNKNEAVDTGENDDSDIQDHNLYEPLDLNLTSKA